jgi:hypothetical protein
VKLTISFLEYVMEPQLIIGALKATTSPGDQSEATNYLNNVSLIYCFILYVKLYRLGFVDDWISVDFG